MTGSRYCRASGHRLRVGDRVQRALTVRSRPFRRAGPDRPGSFVVEEPALPPEPEPKTRDRASLPDHSVARDHDRDRVSVHRSTDGTRGPGESGPAGEFAVGHGPPGRHRAQDLPDGLVEEGSAVWVDRHLKVRAFPPEVLLELPGGTSLGIRRFAANRSRREPGLGDPVLEEIDDPQASTLVHDTKSADGGRHVRVGDGSCHRLGGVTRYLISVSTPSWTFEPARNDAELRRPLGKRAVFYEDDPTSVAGQPVEP